MQTSKALIMLAAVAVGCTASEPTRERLLGAWSGTMTHDGEQQPLALELEPAADGEVQLRLTLPAMNLSRHAMGTVDLAIEGHTITLGPFVFDYDGESDTLHGSMPAALVPVYDIPVSLRRVEAVVGPARLPLAAPLVEPAWVYEAGSPLWAGASFDAGLVYAGDDGGRLHALDAATGRRRWSFRVGGAIRSRPLVTDGALYFQADDGRLYRLDARTGEEAWSVQVVGDPIHRRPPSDPESRWDSFGADVASDGERLFVGTHDGHVLALDPADGGELWRFGAGDSILAAPSVSDGAVYVGGFDGHVHALDAATGALRWKRDTRGAVLSTPAVAEDRLVVGNRADDLLGLDRESGTVAWSRYFWFSWVESSARIVDGIAYIGSSDAAAAFAFDPHDGTRLWKTDVFGWSWGQPAVTEGRVFVGTAALRGYQNDVHQGGVVALERATGHPVWRFAAERPDGGPWGFPGSPAVGAGLVFVTGLDGFVYAFPQ